MVQIFLATDQHGRKQIVFINRRFTQIKTLKTDRCATAQRSTYHPAGLNILSRSDDTTSFARRQKMYLCKSA